MWGQAALPGDGGRSRGIGFALGPALPSTPTLSSPCGSRVKFIETPCFTEVGNRGGDLKG